MKTPVTKFYMEYW